MEPHRIGEARSLAYFERVADRLDDALVASARALATKWIAEGRSVEHLEAWQALLDGPRDVLRATMTADDERSRTLRSCSPFAGTLDPRERWALWRRVKERLETR